MPLITSDLVHNLNEFHTNRQPHDPDAVLINTPKPKWEKGMGHLKISGAFQPRNTLTHSTDILPISRYTSKDRSNDRKRHALDTEISTGDNVVPVHDLPQEVIDLSGPTRLKRPKLESQSSYEISVDGIFDARQSDHYTVKRLQQSQGRSHGTVIKTVSNCALSLGTMGRSFNAEVKEFGSVEQTVKTGEKVASKRRQRKIEKQSQSDFSSAANGVPISPPSPDSDLTQTRILHKQEIANQFQYKGTARTHLLETSHAGPRSQLRDRRENGGQSHHLNNALRSQKLLFRSDFRSVDTNSLSSDELASTHAVVENAIELTPPMHSRPNSPGRSSSSQKATSSSNAIGLEPSNIPASEFTHSRDARPAKRILTQRTTHPGEIEAPWSIDLSCVYVPGDVPVRGPNLGLVFDKVTEVYQIRNMGNILAEMDPSLQIRPKKLLKTMFATNSPKVRFEFSQTGKHDRVLDIELGSDKDVRDLLEELRKKTNKSPKLCDSDHMDKIFKHRQSSSKPYSGRSNESCTVVPEDIQLAARNKERRDLAVDNDSEPASCKRRRPHSEADQDLHKHRLSRGMKLCSREPRSGPISNSRTAEEQADTNGEAGKDRLHAVNHSNPPNPRLQDLRKRSGFGSRNYRGQSPIEEHPRHLRYSVKEGLGNQWIRPLLYPKTGKKKISVEWIDLERLDEGEFLNDNLIAFYLRFLQDQLEERSPELAKRVYFFNTFFFASLTNTPRGKKGINYEAVQKWTRSVNIFSYDYVVVPINESAHWYVAIICNLPALASNPDMAENSQKDEPPLSPDDQNEPDGVSTRYLGRDSSPVANGSVEESCLLVRETKDSTEQVPSASFAEMSLERDSRRRSESGKEGRTEKDTADNSTDIQMKETMAESVQSLKHREAFSGEMEPEEKDDVVIVQKPKAAPVSKKRKRKSIPPTQRIDPTIPIILTFDSLGLAHPITVRILKDYLHAEGSAKRKMELDISRIKGMTAKQIPQQDNMCDCGLFLLGYVDKFLDDPKDFITKVIGHKYDLQKDWPKLIPSDLRANIRTQIQDLHAEQERERQDERRESAKRANKYHERPPQHSDADSSSKTPLPVSYPSEAEEATGGLLPERPATREMGLKTTMPIVKLSDRKAFNVSVKKLTHSSSNDLYLDSSDPLHEDRGNFIRQSPSPLSQKESSLIVIESQSGPAVYKGTTHSEQLSATNSRTRSTSVNLPLTIQDSQPSPFRDLLMADTVYSKRSPPIPSIETEDRHSTGRGGQTELLGGELEESFKDGSQTKKKMSESVNIKEQARTTRQQKQTAKHEILELDD
ncbi:hypothetical protein MMC07_004396 [Pseudocyphellaria aurata]|nr:hypothetical protein [Pseudocyphellaria aurata]